jgi:hypothetical protein
MKKILVAVGVVLSIAASSVFAQANGSITTGTQSNAQQAVSVNNQIGGGSGPADVTYHGGYSVKSAPTVYVPGLTTGGIETCLGSWSAGGSFMGWGAAGGSTKEDVECNVRLTASVAWKMGDKDMAMAVMCESDVWRKAAARQKTDPCKQFDNTAEAPIPAVPQALTSPQQYTDPLVRSRLGMPPLAAPTPAFALK